jgi:hypothetical protein
MLRAIAVYVFFYICGAAVIAGRSLFVKAFVTVGITEETVEAYVSVLLAKLHSSSRPRTYSVLVSPASGVGICPLVYKW